MATGYLLSLCALGLMAAADESWSNCPAVCRCKWNSGRKTAGCANSSLSAVPGELSREIQSLDLSHNPLASIPADALRSAGLVNLHKLFLRACGIRAVHRDAFAGLEILIELDLSWNGIQELHPDTFRDNVRLRVVYVNHNPLRELPDGLFHGLAFLQTVDASDCELGRVGEKAFVDVPSLRDLKLNNNNLTSVGLAAVQRVHSLVSLVLFGNPWRCDCDLKLLVDWAISRNLYTPPTMCREPPPLRGRLWSELAAEDLACRPQVSVPAAVLEAGEDNVTLSCQALGSPAPEMHWVFDSRVLGNSSRRYLLQDRAGSAWRLNLTIAQVGARDAGDYTCVVRSPGGVEERGVVLKVTEGPERRSGARAEGYTAETLSLIAGLAAGGLLLLVAAGVCACCLLRRQGLRARGEPGAASREGAAPADKPASASAPALKSQSAPVAHDTTEMTRVACSFFNSGPCQCSGAEVAAAVAVPPEPSGAGLRGDMAGDCRAYPPDLLPHPQWPAWPAWGSADRLSAYDNLGPRATVDGSAAPAEPTPGVAHAGSQTCQSTLGLSTCQSTLGLSTCQSTLGMSTCQSTLGMSTCQAPGGLPSCQAPGGFPNHPSILGTSTCQAHGEMSTCLSTQGISTCQTHGGAPTCQARGGLPSCRSTQGTSTCQARCGLHTSQASGGLPTCQSILRISTCQSHGGWQACRVHDQATCSSSTCPPGEGQGPASRGQPPRDLPVSVS